MSCRKILETYICGFPANVAISVPVPALLYNDPVICHRRNEKTPPQMFSNRNRFSTCCDMNHILRWILTNGIWWIIEENFCKIEFFVVFDHKMDWILWGALFSNHFWKFQYMSFLHRKKNNVLKWLYFGENFQRR